MPLVTSNQFNLQPDIVGSASRGLQVGQQINQFRDQGKARADKAQTQELTQQILDPNATPEQKGAARQALTALNPAQLANLQKLDASQLNNISAREQNRLKSTTIGSQELLNLPQEKRLPALLSRQSDFQQRKAAGEPVDDVDTSEIIAAYQSGDPQQIEIANQLLEQNVQLGEKLGFLSGGENSGLASAKTEILSTGASIMALPDRTTEVRNPLGEVVTGQERIDVLDAARKERIARDAERQRAVGDIQTEQEITGAGGKEDAKLNSQLKLKPQVEAEVTKARALAAEQGTLFTDLNQMQAALPSLRNTVGSLRELAPIATSTIGGKIFDTVTKETGFGATKGATARAKFIAIINNQVLPLLKPTFGGSFSIQEGAELKATMGDPNGTPAEKMAQLDAFIEQKVRDVEAKELQLQTLRDAESGQSQTPGQALPGAVDLTTLSDEQLMQMRQQAQ